MHCLLKMTEAARQGGSTADIAQLLLSTLFGTSLAVTQQDLAQNSTLISSRTASRATLLLAHAA